MLGSGQHQKRASFSNSKRCAVSECSNARVAGKSYCFFHRNEQVEAGNTSPSPPPPVPAAGVAGGAGNAGSAGKGPPPRPSVMLTQPPPIISPSKPSAPTGPPPPPPSSSSTTTTATATAASKSAVIPPPPPPAGASPSSHANNAHPPPPPPPAAASTPSPSMSSSIPPPPPALQSPPKLVTTTTTTTTTTSAAATTVPPPPPPAALQSPPKTSNHIPPPPPPAVAASTASAANTVPQIPLLAPPPAAAAVSNNMPPPSARSSIIQQKQTNMLGSGSYPAAPRGTILGNNMSSSGSYPAVPRGTILGNNNSKTMPAISHLPTHTPAPSVNLAPSFSTSIATTTAPASATANQISPPVLQSMNSRSVQGSFLYTRAPSTSRFTISAASGNSSLFAVAGSLDMSTLRNIEFHHLTHIPDEISAQVDSGLYAVHRIIAVLKRILSSEEEYWKNHVKVMEHEVIKTERLARDHMERTQFAWDSWKKTQIQVAQKHLETNGTITFQALVPLLEYFTSASQRKKELDRDFTTRQKECSVQQIQLTKELASCVKLIEIWKQMHEEEKKMNSPSGGSGSSGSGNYGGMTSSGGSGPMGQRNSGGFGDGRTSIFSKLTRAVTTLSYSNCAAVQEKLCLQAMKYNDVLVATNRRLEIFHTYELPNYLLELQKLEWQRLELVANSLAIYAQFSEEKHRTLLEEIYAVEFPQQVQELNPTEDMESTMNEWIDNHGFAPAYTPLTYSLPVSIEEIRAGRVLGNPNSVFHVSLSHLMDCQKDTFPNLPIPRFLIYTVEAIRACNNGEGLKQEGIFRISPSKDEMESCKASLNAVGIKGMSRQNLPSGNAYLLSALLKEWLRALTESVIPSSKYQECMQLVKKAVVIEESLMGASAASNGPPPPPGSAAVTRNAAPSTALAPVLAQINAFIGTLPRVNQCVLQYLADLVALIVRDENHKTNRMTIDNLSIVFAPCVLRSASEDPQELLMNSKNEIKFLVLLFKQMAISPSSVTQCVRQLEGSC